MPTTLVYSGIVRWRGALPLRQIVAGSINELEEAADHVIHEIAADAKDKGHYRSRTRAEENLEFVPGEVGPLERAVPLNEIEQAAAKISRGEAYIVTLSRAPLGRIQRVEHALRGRFPKHR